MRRAGGVPKFQGGVKPPHSKVPSAQAFSKPLVVHSSPKRCQK